MAKGNDNGNRLTAPPDFDGPTANRRCTDVLFSLILLLVWAAMTGIGIYSLRGGDYRAVLYPMDYAGNVCGTNFGDMDMTEYPKIVWVNKMLGGVCVKNCPSFEQLIDPNTLLTYGGVYQGDGAFLDANYVEVADYSNATGVLTCNANICNTNTNFSYYSEGINQGAGFAHYAMDTYTILGSRCITNPAAYTEMKKQVYISENTSIIQFDEANAFRALWNNLYGDLWAVREYIMLFGIVGSMAVAFVYSQFLRIPYFLGLVIWGSILGTIAILFGCGGYAWLTANEWEGADPQVHDDNYIRATRICAGILIGLGCLATVITVFLRKQIQLSLGCVKEAARAMSAMPTMILFPIFQVIGVAAFMIVFLVYGVHLASLGDISTKQGPTGVNVRFYEFNDLVKQMGWYLIFCAFWTLCFIMAFGEIVIAMCVSKWYFSRDKSRVGSCTVFSSIIDTARYHTGTAAFGSLLIAVTKMIRAFVTYLQKKARDLDNKVGEALLCCCQCCLWVFEKVIKFLNKNAYIQTAIFGTPFCRSAREAFQLIVRNAGKIASITYVSTLILFIGKLFVSALTTGAAYIYIDREYSEDIYSTAGPCLVIFVMSYFIGQVFLSVFDMSTATVMQCFIADEEMFDGDECYAEGALRKFLDDFEEEEKRLVVAN